MGNSFAMRLPFMGPSREEVVGIATYLTARYGGEALEEARRLEEVVKTLRYPRNIDSTVASGLSLRSEPTLRESADRRFDLTRLRSSWFA